MNTENDRAQKDGAAVACSAWLDAGLVPQSMRRYRITYPHDHKSLRAGDVVVMTRYSAYGNLLLRESDMTLHRLQDNRDQYVHMVERKGSV